MTCDKTNSPLALAGYPAVIAHMNQLQSIINRLPPVAHVKVPRPCDGYYRLGRGNARAGCRRICAGAHNDLRISRHVLPSAEKKLIDNTSKRHAEDIRQLRYELKNVFDVRVKSGVTSAILAFTSWSIWPVYIGLATVFFVARHQGYLQLIAGRT